MAVAHAALSVVATDEVPSAAEVVIADYLVF